MTWYDWYPYFKAIHIMAVLAWMAGLFYLPRLFVYHVKAKPGSELSETFKIMEGKLLRVIMCPAMTVSWLFGLAIVFSFNVVDLYNDIWMQLKLVLVSLMTVYHFYLSKWRNDFAKDGNIHTERFYRIINEVPTLLMIGIVLLVIIRPF
ncbi:MAG: protoporphyrinogen oxidase HemJ [Alphaproteobacteria bacterium]